MDKGQFLLYQTPDGDSQIEVKLQNDTVWLSLDQMAELFQRNKSTISRHIKNVLEDGELDEMRLLHFLQQPLNTVLLKESYRSIKWLFTIST